MLRSTYRAAASSRSASPVTSPVSWNPKVLHRVYDSSPQNSDLKLPLGPVHTDFLSFNFYFNVPTEPPLPEWSFPFRYLTPFLVCTADLTRPTRTANLIFLYVMLITYDDKNKLWVSNFTPPSSFQGSNQLSSPHKCHSFWSSGLQIDSKKRKNDYCSISNYSRNWICSFCVT